MPRSIRVGICDASPALRFGLKHILDSDPSIVTVLETSSHQEMLTHHVDSDIDILVADIPTDNPDSFECLRKFKETRPDVRIILFSSCADKEVIMKSMEIGVQGIHDKQADPEELIKAVHTVHRGGNSLATCVTTALVNYIATKNREEASELSNREEEVLSLIAEGKSNSDIADQLYISVRTVKFHISSIFSKLNVKNRTQAAALWVR